MTLLEIRTKFIERSGRIDLVGEDAGNPDYEVDNGADWFINEGIRELDGYLPEPMNTKTVSESIAAGTTSLTVSGLRVPLEVWCTDSSNNRWALNKKTQRALRENYGVIFSAVDSGSPSHWAIANQAKSATPNTNMSLSILPPADTTYTMEVLGHFWSDALEDNTDENWWTVNHPGLVVLAALYALETSMRNTAGANDWLTAIERRIRAIEHDMAEGTAVDFVELAG